MSEDKNKKYKNKKTNTNMKVNIIKIFSQLVYLIKNLFKWVLSLITDSMSYLSDLGSKDNNIGSKNNRNKNTTGKNDVKQNKQQDGDNKNKQSSNEIINTMGNIPVPTTKEIKDINSSRATVEVNDVSVNASVIIKPQQLRWEVKQIRDTTVCGIIGDVEQMKVELCNFNDGQSLGRVMKLTEKMGLQGSVMILEITVANISVSIYPANVPELAIGKRTGISNGLVEWSLEPAEGNVSIPLNIADNDVAIVIYNEKGTLGFAIIENIVRCIIVLDKKKTFLLHIGFKVIDRNMAVCGNVVVFRRKIFMVVAKIQCKDGGIFVVATTVLLTKRGLALSNQFVQAHIGSQYNVKAIKIKERQYGSWSVLNFSSCPSSYINLLKQILDNFGHNVRLNVMTMMCDEWSKWKDSRSLLMIFDEDDEDKDDKMVLFLRYYKGPIINFKVIILPMPELTSAPMSAYMMSHHISSMTTKRAKGLSRAQDIHTIKNSAEKVIAVVRPKLKFVTGVAGLTLFIKANNCTPTVYPSSEAEVIMSGEMTYIATDELDELVKKDGDIIKRSTILRKYTEGSEANESGSSDTEDDKDENKKEDDIKIIS